MDQALARHRQKSDHQPFTYKGHDNEVNTVAWSYDGQYIASGGQDNTVQVWSPMTGTIAFTYTKHTALVSAVA